MNTSATRKRKKWPLIAALVLLLVGAILYKLADRYLIEHVEAVVANEAETAGQGDSAETEPQNAAYDDWNYESDDVSIHITKNQTGSGDDTVTYFVADVMLQDASALKTALAKNAFGRNIIENTSTIAENNNAIFAINGDYYGFRDDGVIIRNGTLYRDEPARDALGLFADGTLQTFDEEEISSSELLEQGVEDTLSFGPILVQDGQVAGDLDHVSIDTNFGNRSIEGANPRTGIGMIAPNHYVFVVVDGRDEGYSRGMTLTEFANLFKELGATEAYNLDGGGSSTMYFMGRVVNQPQGGKNEERGVSDIIYIGE
ncbi:phosphodiester glycosidase family protein [Paenibacillus thailandensis]|uniref:Phosphodiester glycosidase family protein n=1 Tax=Paenibacillus thailandensis TaxID=393250 RepID=A0ABW5R462_9BACL